MLNNLLSWFKSIFSNKTKVVEIIPTQLHRIHLHWTGGADGLNAIETDSYHFIIARDGKIYKGQDEPEDNIPPLKNPYAAHTLNANSNAIGVALDAMGGANEKPFRTGKYPITEIQVESLVNFVATLCKKYGIAVTRQTVLTHAEIQRTLGIKQNNKWDITWLPGMVDTKDAIVIGDILRQRIQASLNKL